MKLKNSLTISSVFLGIIPLLVVAILNYNDFRLNLITSSENDLKSLSNIKIDNLNSLFARYLEDISVVQDYYNIRTNLSIVEQSYQRPNDPQYQKAKTTLDEQLRAWSQYRPDIDNIMLINLDGTIVYSTNEKYSSVDIGHKLSEAHDPATFEKGLISVYQSDFFTDKAEDNRLYFLVAAPIHDFNNHLVGEVAMEVNTTDFFNITNQSTGLGQTGELVVSKLCFDRSGICSSAPDNFKKDFLLFLNPLRFPINSNNQTTALAFGSNSALPSQYALKGQNDSGFSTDYRGQTVFAVWHYLPDQKLGIVIKKDLAEITQPSFQIAHSAFLISVLGISFLFVALRTLISSAFRPLESLEKVADKVSQNDLEVTFDPYVLKGSDEVSNLSRSFEIMIRSLKDYYRNLEAKVKDRTRELEQARAKDDAILTSIGDGVIATDDQGRVIFLNQSAIDMLQLSSNFIGQPLTEIVQISSEDNTVLINENRPMNQVLYTKKPFHSSVAQTLFYRRSDGSRFPVALTVTPIILNDQLIGTIEVFRDITFEKEIDKAKTEFISIASHQLRTPLSAVKWYTSMLIEGTAGQLNPEQLKFLDTINISNNRMIDLVNALLNVSRIEMGTFSVEPASTDIVSVAQSVIDEQIVDLEAKHLKLETNFASDLPTVVLDPKYLRMIFQNLISNSIKYSREMGSIKFDIHLDESKNNFVTTISDNGIGIPQDQQSQIFSKLFRADNVREHQVEGTGLGLYIVKSIVDYSDGKIWFESKENQGSTFFVSLPLTGMQKKQGTRRLA